MKAKINTTLVLLFLTTFIFGQTTNRDSLIAFRASLKSQIDSLNKSLSVCSDFELSDNPKWTNNIKTSKTYYRNCRWSGTYIVLNKDSTFLFKHNGEGSNHLQKGKWEIKSDSILVLKSIDRLTVDFKLKMKKFEKTNYNSSSTFSRQYLFRQNMLVQVDNLSQQ